MDKAESQSFPADSEQNLIAKRTRFEEPNTAPDAKRIESSHDELTEPDVRTPPITWEGSSSFPREGMLEPLNVRKCSNALKPAVLEERNGEIEFRVVNNDGSRESTIILIGLKFLFQKQLPKMPKDYIARLVYDPAHLSIAIVKRPLEVIGGATFREFRDREFAEIVFCAVSSYQQVKGYGAHLMAHLKDYIKATSLVMHFLTYADNYATGVFSKTKFYQSDHSRQVYLDGVYQGLRRGDTYAMLNASPDTVSRSWPYAP